MSIPPRARRAILTGAGSARGIGIATAEHLVRQGWTVALTDLHADGLRANAERLAAAGATSVPVAVGDVRVEEDVDRAVGELLGVLGGVEALVNVAGISRPTRTLEISLEEWENVFAVNSRGTFLVTRAVSSAGRTTRPRRRRCSASRARSLASSPHEGSRATPSPPGSSTPISRRPT